MERFPIVVAAHVWGCHWPCLQVEFPCDNRAVVAIINSGSLRGPLSLHLMRRLGLVACQFQFRSPLAMSTVVPGPSLVSSLGLKVRDSTGFLPPPTRLLPASLQLSYRCCSPFIRVAVFNLCCPGVSGLVSPASGRTKLGSLTFVAFLPVSEFTASPPIEPARHLAPTAVEFCQAIHHLGLRLRFKFSTTDPRGAGHSIYIGATGTHLCPVLALRSYIAHCGSLAGRSWCG